MPEPYGAITANGESVGRLLPRSREEAPASSAAPSPEHQQIPAMPIAATPTPARKASAARKPTASEPHEPGASAGKGQTAPSSGAAAAGGGGAGGTPRLSR